MWEQPSPPLVQSPSCWSMCNVEQFCVFKCQFSPTEAFSQEEGDYFQQLTSSFMFVLEKGIVGKMQDG